MQIKEIGATSRVSFKQQTKSGDVFYTFEFTQLRSIDPTDNLDEQNKDIWKCVNDQVTQQIIETKNLYKTQN